LSTQQVLGVVGGVVGAFFGYPQLGFVVGSLIGGLLTPTEKTEGPRLDDQKVTVSTYGAGRPVLYGTGRMGGNVVWSTDKIELATTTEAGKGGGVENTTYRYFVHMFISLCETPPPGTLIAIRKIWQDGKLVYDVSSGMPVTSSIASAENPNARLLLMPGYEDQQPISGMEAWMGGPGSVPAYRGTCGVYMVAVECDGGRVPQFSFELTTSAQDVLTSTEFINFDSTFLNVVTHAPDFSSVRVLYGPGWDNLYSKSRVEVREVSPAGGYQVTGSFIAASNTTPARGYSDETAFVNSPNGLTFNYHNQFGMVTQFIAPEFLAFDLARFAKAGNVFAVGTIYGSTPGPYVFQFAENTINSEYRDMALGYGVWALGLSEEFIYVLHAGPGITALIDKFDLATLTYVETVATLTSEQNNTFMHVVSDTEIHVSYWNGTEWAVGVVENGSVRPLFEGVPELSTIQRYGGTFFVNNNILLQTTVDTGLAVSVKSVVLNEVAVADIFDDQCRRSGLASDLYDTSVIDDLVHGYTLTNPASARSNIEPLMTAYGIFATEEDSVLKFKYLRDVTALASIAYDELACVEQGGESGDPMPLTRAQEAELPRTMAVSYQNKDFDYQTATEKAIRQATQSQLDQTVEMPISTDSNHAATVAHRILYNTWAERNMRSLKVSRAYAFLSAGDGVNVEYPRGTVQLWRIIKATDTGVICEWDVVPADAEILTQVAVGASGYAGQEVSPLPPSTVMQILDTPILRDEDNDAGPYVALSGVDSGYPGGQLFVGDDDSSLQPRGTVELEAPMGVAETALGDWSMNIADETNVLTVNVGHHALSSVTYPVFLAGTSNVAAVGIDGRWEIIKFRTASSLGGGRYILSGLLRGLRGTEHNRGNHTNVDSFVILATAGMLRPSTSVGEIGMSKRYKAVTKGRSPSTVASVGFTNEGEGLKPFSPWDLRKSKAASNEQTLTWRRRTRLSSNSLRGIVPLGEVSERYEVDFYTTSGFSTFAGTLETTTPSLAVTSAQQTALGLTPGAALNVRVYQISDSIGRGHALQGTL
jgi:hypothetical protein